MGNVIMQLAVQLIFKPLSIHINQYPNLAISNILTINYIYLETKMIINYGIRTNNVAYLKTKIIAKVKD